ncbi:hypothetical protein EON62_03360, partial [archaeon]
MTAHGQKPRLVIDSGSIIDFEYRVVLSDAARRVPYGITATLRNADESNELRWQADTSNLRPLYGGLKQVFSMEPDGGVIPPAGSVTLKIRFLPFATREFTNTIPIYVMDDDNKEEFVRACEEANATSATRGDGGADRRPALTLNTVSGPISSDTLAPYLELELKGTGIQPQLSFNVRDVLLPAVPLGVEARAIFYVMSHGFDHLELRHRLVAGGATNSSAPSASSGSGGGGGSSSNSQGGGGGFASATTPRETSRASGRFDAMPQTPSAGGSGGLTSRFSGGFADASDADGFGRGHASAGVSTGVASTAGSSRPSYNMRPATGASHAGTSVMGGAHSMETPPAVDDAASGAASMVAVPITLSFPQGQVLSLSRVKVPVIVHFRSATPLAFTTNIEFTDSLG